MVRTLISFLMLTSQWRVLIIYNITHSYCNSGAERYLPGELLLKSPCKSEKNSKSQLHKQLKRAPLKAGDVLLKRSFNSREIQCLSSFSRALVSGDLSESRKQLSGGLPRSNRLPVTPVHPNASKEPMSISK